MKPVKIQIFDHDAENEQRISPLDEPDRLTAHKARRAGRGVEVAAALALVGIPVSDPTPDGCNAALTAELKRRLAAEVSRPDYKGMSDETVASIVTSVNPKLFKAVRGERLVGIPYAPNAVTAADVAEARKK